MPLLAYANYAMGSPQVGFFFRVKPPTILYLICLVSVLVSAFYFKVPSWMLYSPMGAQPLGFAPLQSFGVSHGRHMCNLMIVIGPHLVCIEWLLPQVGEPSATHSAVPQPIDGVYSLGGSIESPDPSTFPT